MTEIALLTFFPSSIQLAKRSLANFCYRVCTIHRAPTLFMRRKPVLFLHRYPISMPTWICNAVFHLPFFFFLVLFIRAHVCSFCHSSYYNVTMKVKRKKINLLHLLGKLENSYRVHCTIHIHFANTSNSFNACVWNGMKFKMRL